MLQGPAHAHYEVLRNPRSAPGLSHNESHRRRLRPLIDKRRTLLTNAGTSECGGGLQSPRSQLDHPPRAALYFCGARTSPDHPEHLCGGNFPRIGGPVGSHGLCHRAPQSAFCGLDKTVRTERLDDEEILPRTATTSTTPRSHALFLSTQRRRSDWQASAVRPSHLFSKC